MKLEDIKEYCDSVFTEFFHTLDSEWAGHENVDKSAVLRPKDVIRIVSRFALLQSCPIFGYRGAYAPLLSSYRGRACTMWTQTY